MPVLETLQAVGRAIPALVDPDLWVLRFAADGRVEDFEESPYYRPGEPYSAAGES